MAFGWLIMGQELGKENSCSQTIAVMKNAIGINDLKIFWVWRVFWMKVTNYLERINYW